MTRFQNQRHGGLIHMSEHLKPTISPDEALERLKAGNERFLTGIAKFPTIQKEILADLVKGQNPYATILCCSDSRVPPELIFDAGLGELFIIRVAGKRDVAGNCGKPAVRREAFTHAPVCGARSHEMRGRRRGNRTRLHGTGHDSRIQLLVNSMLPGLADLDLEGDAGASSARAVEANVRWSMRQILETPEGRERTSVGELKLIGAVYEIETGRVRFLG